MVLLMIDAPLSIEAVIHLSHLFFSVGRILSLWAFEKDRQAKRSL
jgi:hypothetical protein